MHIKHVFLVGVMLSTVSLPVSPNTSIPAHKICLSACTVAAASLLARHLIKEKPAKQNIKGATRTKKPTPTWKKNLDKICSVLGISGISIAGLSLLYLLAKSQYANQSPRHLSSDIQTAVHVDASSTQTRETQTLVETISTACGPNTVKTFASSATQIETPYLSDGSSQTPFASYASSETQTDVPAEEHHVSVETTSTACGPNTAKTFASSATQIETPHLSDGSSQTPFASYASSETQTDVTAEEHQVSVETTSTACGPDQARHTTSVGCGSETQLTTSDAQCQTDEPYRSSTHSYNYSLAGSDPYPFEDDLGSFTAEREERPRPVERVIRTRSHSTPPRLPARRRFSHRDGLHERVQRILSQHKTFQRSADAEEDNLADIADALTSTLPPRRSLSRRSSERSLFEPINSSSSDEETGGSTEWIDAAQELRSAAQEVEEMASTLETARQAIPASPLRVETALKIQTPERSLTPPLPPRSPSPVTPERQRRERSQSYNSLDGEIQCPSATSCLDKENKKESPEKSQFSKPRSQSTPPQRRRKKRLSIDPGFHPTSRGAEAQRKYLERMSGTRSRNSQPKARRSRSRRRQTIGGNPLTSSTRSNITN